MCQVYQACQVHRVPSGASGMSGGLGTMYFATSITFFVDKNQVAQLAPKLLPVGHTATFLFWSLLSQSCHTACAHDYVIKSSPFSPLLPATVSSGQHTAFQKIRNIWKKLHFGQSHSESHHNCLFSLSHISLHYVHFSLSY